MVLSRISTPEQYHFASSINVQPLVCTDIIVIMTVLSGEGKPHNLKEEGVTIQRNH